ncbi:MAG TPA: DUF1549 domain-containing protein, partial [Pirellulales bacterium]
MKKFSFVRDLVFVVVVLGGLAALGASVFPERKDLGQTWLDTVPLAASGVPDVAAEIDALFAKSWPDESVQPAPDAPPGAIARRLSLALTGTIPSLEEIRALEKYLADGGDPALTAQFWLDRLLDNRDDRRAGDYLAERLARSMVGTHLDPFIVYRRRRFVMWLSEQIRENRPWNDMVREMIAGRGLWTDHPALNFLTSTIEQGNDRPHPNPETLAAMTSQAFLGVRLDCAQCHDHPFVNAWTQDTFRGLAAFFTQTRNSLKGIHDDPSAPLEFTDLTTNDKVTVAAQAPFLPELLPGESRGSLRERLADWLVDPQNNYFAEATANRMWALLVGRAMAEPVDDFVAQGPPPETLKRLARDFSEHGYDLKRLIRVIAATSAFRRDSRAEFEITEAHECSGAAFPLTRLRPEQVAGAVLQAASLPTIDQHSHIFVQFGRFEGEQKFVERYGDAGGDELREQNGTIPQRLLMLNGGMVAEQVKADATNASQQLAMLAKSDDEAIRL